MHKQIKLADLLLQVGITLGCMVRAIILKDISAMIWFYFILGGWQVFSFVCHILFRPPWMNRKSRREYGQVLVSLSLAFLILYLLLVLDLPLLIWFLFAMLFIGPVMAIFYFMIGTGEWTTIRHREFIHLK